MYEKRKVHTTAFCLQEMDVLCLSSSGAVLLPQKHVPGSASGGSPLLLGPLFPGQALTCQEGNKVLGVLSCMHDLRERSPSHANSLLRDTQPRLVRVT